MQGIQLHLEDPDAPILQFTTKSGKSVAINLIVLIDKQTDMGKEILQEWLEDQKRA